MSKRSTLSKVEEEIAAGKLGIARDRLQGLIAAMVLVLVFAIVGVAATIEYFRH